MRTEDGGIDQSVVKGLAFGGTGTLRLANLLIHRFGYVFAIVSIALLVKKSHQCSTLSPPIIQSLRLSWVR